MKEKEAALTSKIDAGFYLKRMRKKEYLSQATLAGINDISGTKISKYERNEKEITLNLFLKICRSLGVTDFNALFDREVEHNLTASVSSIVDAIKKVHDGRIPENTIGIAISENNEDSVMENPTETKEERPKLL